MAFRHRCEQCGKSAQFSEGDAGMTALCTACGNRFVVPYTPPEPAAPPSPASTLFAQNALPLDPSPFQTAPILGQRISYPILYSIVGGLVTLSLVAVAIFVLSTTHPPKALATISPAPAPKSLPATAPAKSDEIVKDWPEYDPRPIEIATKPKPPVETKPIEPPRPATRPIDPAPAVAIKPPVNPLGVSTSPKPATGLARPPITVRKRADDTRNQLTDEAIGKAIQAGVDHLIGQFKNGTLGGAGTKGNGGNAYFTGLNALNVYALLQCSYAIKDERLSPMSPFVKDMIAKMKALPAESGTVTYARGIRATALALINRPDSRTALLNDVDYLIGTHINGGYTYAGNLKKKGPTSPAAPNQQGQAMLNRIMEGHWDNSNSQYGLLGVWAGAEVGIEVPSAYWKAVDEHWTTCQNEDGSWGYNNRGGAKSGGRLSMTLAGCASLFVTHDWLDAIKAGSTVGREPFSKALAKGLAYLETGDNAVRVNGGYSLYGLERVGLASGFKYFGDHDWYRELASHVIRNQANDGSFGSQIETPYNLLFLARGRHPILMNKLRYDGYWANRPRDVANLARFGSRELERPLNWQVVPITRDWTDWMDSPILYIASHVAVKFTDADIDKIRNFALAGGMIFTQADGSRTEADGWARSLAKKLFPLYEMRELPDDHDLYTVLFRPSPHPALRGVSNGARLLMVHSPTDITQSWQTRQEKSKRSLFELGINMHLYAAGKGDLRNRLSSSYIPPQGNAGGGAIKVARVKFPGNWDPEPMAWTRFSRYFQRETDVALNVSAVDLDQLDVNVAPFAHWTGTDPYTPTAAEMTAIQKFVEAGGVLLIDPCGGSGEFYESIKLALQRTFPKSPTLLVSTDHPMLKPSGPGMEDCSIPMVRKYVKAKNISTSGRLDCINAGKGKVIFNPLDLTNGLVGANTWGILGFDSGYASTLVKNILLWSATGMKEQ